MSQLPTAMASTQHADQEPEGQLERVRGLGEFGGIQQIDGEFPVRQRVADFGGDERPLPSGLKTGARKGHRLGVVVEDRQADFIAQFRLARPDRAGRPRPGPGSIARRRSGRVRC